MCDKQLGSNRVQKSPVDDKQIREEENSTRGNNSAWHFCSHLSTTLTISREQSADGFLIMKFSSSAIAFATLFKVTYAFAPPSSSFTRSSALPTSAQTSSGATTFQQGFGAHPMSTSRQDTSLQMAAGGNLINRFVKVTQANANRVLQSLEAPEKIMNQALIDMQNDLVKVRQSYAEITSSQRRLVNERDEAEAEADRWYKRAQLAMKTGNDGLAKEALIRKQQQMEVVNKIQLQIDGQAVAADKLYDGLRALEAKIMEAKQRKAEFVARAKAAESTQKVNDMLSGVTGNSSMDAFKRMEEKVEALEAAAEASAEMAGLALPGYSSSTSEIENEFLLLEGNAAVEEEFTRMKTKMLGGLTEKSKVSIKSEKIFDPSIETEFEMLKAKATGGEKVTIPVTSGND